MQARLPGSRTSFRRRENRYVTEGIWLACVRDRSSRVGVASRCVRSHVSRHGKKMRHEKVSRIPCGSAAASRFASDTFPLKKTEKRKEKEGKGKHVRTIAAGQLKRGRIVGSSSILEERFFARFIVPGNFVFHARFSQVTLNECATIVSLFFEE